MPDTRTGVYAEGGLGRFDTLPGDIQLLIWDMAQIGLDMDKAAITIQKYLRKLRAYANFRRLLGINMRQREHGQLSARWLARYPESFTFDHV